MKQVEDQKNESSAISPNQMFLNWSSAVCSENYHTTIALILTASFQTFCLNILKLWYDETGPIQWLFRDWEKGVLPITEKSWGSAVFNLNIVFQSAWMRSFPHVDATRTSFGASFKRRPFSIIAGTYYGKISACIYIESAHQCKILTGITSFRFLLYRYIRTGISSRPSLYSL